MAIEIPKDPNARKVPITLIGAWDSLDAISSRMAKRRFMTRREYHREIERLSTAQDTDLRRELDSLDGEERKWFLQLLRDIKEAGGVEYSTAYKALWEIDYKEQPVTIERFLDDPYYLGNSTETLFPTWRHELREVFSPLSQVVEWHLGGAIGGGKSWTSMIGLSFLIYRLGCLLNPQRYYGLADGSKIVLGVYSVTLGQVNEVGYDKLRTFVETSPWFSEKLGYNRKLTSSLRFNNNVRVVVGSKAIHVLGKDLFAFMMDEANFMQGPSEKNPDPNARGQAEEIYIATLRRLTSRFMRNGRSPGMVFLASSKTSEDSFMERRKREAKDEIAKGLVRISEFPVWAGKPRDTFKLPYFYVEVGDQIWPSKVLKAATREQAEGEARSGATVAEIPGDYRSHFTTDTDKALRDFAGIATYGTSPLFKERYRIFDCITDTREHPFTRQEVVISDQDESTLDDYFVPERLFITRASNYVPRFFPNMPRFIHVDIGLREDSLGMVCGCVSGMIKTKRTRPDGTLYEDKVPSVHIDFAIRVLPPDQGSIDLGKVRGFIQSLRDMGLPVFHLSWDGYQSEDSMQIMRRIGFSAMKFSVDRSDEPYLSLRQAFTDKRVSMYKHDHLVKELLHLERNLDEQKVDHPAKFPDGTRGSKDIADCLCAVVYECTAMPVAHAPVEGSTVETSRNVQSSRDTIGRKGRKINWDAVNKIT